MSLRFAISTLSKCGSEYPRTPKRILQCAGLSSKILALVATALVASALALPAASIFLHNHFARIFHQKVRPYRKQSGTVADGTRPTVSPSLSLMFSTLQDLCRTRSSRSRDGPRAVDFPREVVKHEKPTRRMVHDKLAKRCCGQCLWRSASGAPHRPGRPTESE